MMNSIMCELYAKISLPIPDTIMQCDVSTQIYESLPCSYTFKLTQYDATPKFTNYTNTIRMASSADFRGLYVIPTFPHLEAVYEL